MFLRWLAAITDLCRIPATPMYLQCSCAFMQDNIDEPFPGNRVLRRGTKNWNQWLVGRGTRDQSSMYSSEKFPPLWNFFHRGTSYVSCVFSTRLLTSFHTFKPLDKDRNILYICVIASMLWAWPAFEQNQLLHYKTSWGCSAILSSWPVSQAGRILPSSYRFCSKIWG